MNTPEQNLSALKILESDLRAALKETKAAIEVAETKIWLAKSRQKNDERKERLRRSLKLRAGGMTVREIGAELGVGYQRSLQLIHQAERWNSANKL